MNDAKPSAERRSRAKQKELTRQRLVDVTLQLMQDRSFDGISMREVTREAGVVPTAFYRHFESMEELGVELVDESMQKLRRVLRDVRRRRDENKDTVSETIAVLAHHVRNHPAQFRFIARERYGGVAAVRKTINDEVRLVRTELVADLSQLPVGRGWSTDDLDMVAALMLAAGLRTTTDLLDALSEQPDAVPAIMERAERQLRLISLGMQAWNSQR